MSDSNENSPSPETSRPARGRGAGIRAAVIVVCLLAVLGMLGIIPRLKLQPRLESDAAAAKTTAPTVNIIKPKAAPATTRLNLPGDVEGVNQTAISARATGYVRKWYADIGDHVTAGQVLALIETPDTDEQVAQAQAQVSGSVASVQQARANYFMMVANEEQAQANVSKAQASYQQSRTDLAHSQAAEAQTIEATSQGRAQLRSSQASLNLAKVTADRYQLLASQGAVAQQAADQQTSAFQSSQANTEALQAGVRATQATISEAHQTVLSSQSNVQAFLDGVRAARAAVKAAQANVHAAQASIDAASSTVASNQANLRGKAIIQGFQKVVAPFDGIITGRNVEVGALVSAAGGLSATTGSAVSAGSAGSASASSLFSMVSGNAVRVFVSVPETFSGEVRPGQAAAVSVQELGAKPVIGVINRDTSVLDATSRTLRAQIDVPNPGGRLRPGMFATVTMVLPVAQRAWRIADTALIADASGTRVATVTPDNKIHYQPVTVGRDYGKEMDITTGLTGRETLVANPTVALTEGLTVKPVVVRTKEPSGAPDAAHGGAGQSGGGRKGG